LQNFYKQVSDPYINQSPKHNPQVLLWCHCAQGFMHSKG